MVTMVASGFGGLRRYLGEPSSLRGGTTVAASFGLVPSASIAVSSKQRASVKWLLSKAFNNRVPDNLLEPFYRDHEDQEHLKPPIIGGLANAELYCLALANIYSDPNYHNLNHWNILQTLTRKGITVETPSDCALTETVLIQTNPLRMNAHMHVIEAIMCLYSKEVVTWERVNAAVQRFTATPVSLPSTDSAVEGGLLVWINSACSALNDAQLSESELPQVAPVTSLQEVCDGTALAALISFYCPDALPRSRLRVGKVTSLQDCLHNLMAVYEFCANHLPHNIFHMLPEDVAYMRGSMRQNLIVLLSDLFNMLELHPVKCVKYPSSEIGLANSNEHGVMLSRRCLPPPQQQPIPDLRPDLDSESTFKVSVTTAARGRAAGRSACSTPEGRGCSPQRDFTVHKNKPIPTLSNVASDMTPAGRPSSRCDEGRSYSGRRSRRSSITDDSQLTLENFGGSQDRLNFLGRNPEKELATVNSMRKISAPAGAVVQNTPVRSTLQDARGSIHFFYDDYDTVPTYEDKRPGEIKFTQQQTNDSFPTIKRQLSSDNISTYRPINRSDESGFYLNSNSADLLDGDIGNNKLASFADINNMRSKREQSGIESVYSNQIENNSGVRRKSTTFAQSPNITTWQQQSMQQEIQHNGAMADENLSDPDQTAMASQLNNIRLKLEEKRRRILREKQRMEAALGQQRAQMGQQAFLQAVARSKGDGGSDTPVETPHKTIIEAPEIQDIDIKSVENKWLEHDAVNRTPDVDALGYDEYHQSIAQMNSSLQELQTDISRLANQQIQLQSNQFFSPPPKPQPTSFQPSAQNFSPQNPYFSQQNNPNFNPQKHTNFIPQNSQNFSPQNNQIFQSSPHLVSNNNISQNYPSPQSYETNSFHLNQNSNLNHQNSYQSNRQSFQPNLIHNQNLKKIDYDHQSYVQNQEQYERNSIAQNMNPLHNAYSAHNVSTPPRLISSSSQPLVTQAMEPNGHFYLHESSPQRRTWTHKVQTHNDDRNWQSPSPQRSSSRDSPIRSWKSPSPPPPSSRDPWNPQPGFLLHDPDERSSHKADGETRPYRRIALEELENNSGAAVTAPPEDVMEPQNISFISSGVARLNITSGSRTYRIPETTRRQRTAAEGEDDQGFYISLDDEGPRRPKPQLRPRRGGVGEGSRTTPPGRASPPPSASHPPRTKSPDNDFLLKTKIVQRNTNSDSAALIIGDLENVDPESVEEMEKKKERIILLSLQRRQRAEDARARAEQAAASRRTKELALAEQKAHRRAEQSRRREEILQQHKLKKAIEEAEREGKNIDQSKLLQRQHSTAGSSSTSGGGGTARMRRNQGARAARPRTIHVDASAALQRSTSNLTAYGSASMRRDYYRGSQDSLSTLHYRDSPAEDSRGVSPGANSNNALGRRGSYKTSREHTSDVESTGSGRSKYSTFQNNLKTGRKSSSLMNLCDSGLGRATPRGKSPGGARTLPSPSSGPGSLPHHRVRRHNPADDSDTASNHSSMADYSGPRLYKQPTTKSNRGIMLNAVEYCVFPGAVNKEAKRRVLEEIARSESKHFLVLFRDAGCQFRALYSYCPESENVIKLYGTGPRSVNDRMFDKFFKYNSGSKCFSQVHTKHLTVTIDAFTIHNSLWQGKKVQLPSKKDMALVI